MCNVEKSKCKRTLSSRLSKKAADFKQGRNKIAKTNSIYYGDSTSDNKSEINSIENQVDEFTTSYRLGNSYFNQPCISLGKSLLGKLLVRKLDTGEILKGKIVETECYLGGIDKASHSYQGKRTVRNEAMFYPPGTAYVYSVYGMYYCFNISSLEEGSAVLIRAIEPLENISTMLALRTMKGKGTSSIKDKDLCNGPSKICQAFHIDKQSLNKVDMCESEYFWVEDGENIPHCDIVECKRIGIESAGQDWANKPLRFYIKGCPWVSVRNKIAEKNYSSS
ncbi:hypothetical protein JTE90_014680 [Oedothorax gibbosus]|uniref:DNA-3-methyladenine glycosylase n=1 Tax=Oedothorax gibbosus TaxID=931172 RepID=A0AAV6UGT9_9ARAC|nr:hypothetical protein JTE90_014680 [Oedothorax gibbosus]